jgi:DNA-binding transcriptional regulator YdaS (Cro superfamily)
VHDVIKHFGGKSALADALGVDPAAVSWWLKNGLPALRAIQIETLTGGKFKAKDILGAKDDG